MSNTAWSCHQCQQQLREAAPMFRTPKMARLSFWTLLAWGVHPIGHSSSGMFQNHLTSPNRGIIDTKNPVFNYSCRFENSSALFDTVLPMRRPQMTILSPGRVTWRWLRGMAASSSDTNSSATDFIGQAMSSDLRDGKRCCDVENKFDRASRPYRWTLSSSSLNDPVLSSIQNNQILW